MSGDERSEAPEEGAARSEETARPSVLRMVRAELDDFLEEPQIDPYEADPAERDLRRAAVLSMALTLLIVVMSAPPRTHLLTPLVAAAGLAAPGMARNRWYWFFLAGLFAMSPIDRAWLQLDNHHWLQLYWVVAIAVSRFAYRPDHVLRASARLLVGLAFLFAAGWKLLSAEFMSGAFYDATFSMDRRLADVAVALGLQDRSVLGSNAGIVTGWRAPGTTPTAEALQISDAVRRITPMLAWLTVVVEAAVAVTFLAPLVRRWCWVRDIALLTFVLTTYPLAPVVGFGQLLVAMSAMQSELRSRIRAIAYVGAFVAVALTSERDPLLDLARRVFAEGG